MEHCCALIEFTIIGNNVGGNLYITGRQICFLFFYFMWLFFVIELESCALIFGVYHCKKRGWHLSSKKKKCAGIIYHIVHLDVPSKYTPHSIQNYIALTDCSRVHCMLCCNTIQHHQAILLSFVLLIRNHQQSVITLLIKKKFRKWNFVYDIWYRRHTNIDNPCHHI